MLFNFHHKDRRNNKNTDSCFTIYTWPFNYNAVQCFVHVGKFHCYQYHFLTNMHFILKNRNFILHTQGVKINLLHIFWKNIIVHWYVILWLILHPNEPTVKRRRKMALFFLLEPLHLTKLVALLMLLQHHPLFPTPRLSFTLCPWWHSYCLATSFALPAAGNTPGSNVWCQKVWIIGFQTLQT